MLLNRIAESRNRQRGQDDVVQEFGTVYPVPIGLGENVRSASITALNQLLADTMALRDLYKKHHWQVSGATFYQLHLLFDKHYDEQVEVMDKIAERITALGGVPLAAPHDVAEATSIARPPKGGSLCRPSSRACSMRTSRFWSNVAERRRKRATMAMTGQTT
jgi:hypothetical protein